MKIHLKNILNYAKSFKLNIKIATFA